MKVSVCIPTYNQGPFIEQSVRSALNQTLQPFEIIVSNDCSTDDTGETLNRLNKEISILKIINQPVNLGISKNTDFCLRAATGDFIVRLDSDDFLSPLYIEKLSLLLVNNPNAGYAHGSVQEVDQHGNFLRQRRLGRKSGFQNSEDALQASTKGYRVAANILIFRKEALVKVNYVASTANFAEDYYMVVSIAVAGFGNIYRDEILSNYRVWVDTGKVRQRRKLDEIIGYRKLFDEVLEPAYLDRKWDMAVLKKRRADFASRHADCLSWDVYTNDEKLQLKKELSALSSSLKANWFAWMYLHGFGNILSGYEQLKVAAKSKIKAIISPKVSSV
jgi:glycosyltransferase involved in cell wall biosynthesis